MSLAISTPEETFPPALFVHFLFIWFFLLLLLIYFVYIYYIHTNVVGASNGRRKQNIGWRVGVWYCPAPVISAIHFFFFLLILSLFSLLHWSGRIEWWHSGQFLFVLCIYIFFYFLSMNVTMLTSFIMTYTICVFFSLLFSVGKRVSSLFFLRILKFRNLNKKNCAKEREMKSNLGRMPPGTVD